LKVSSIDANKSARASAAVIPLCRASECWPCLCACVCVCVCIVYVCVYKYVFMYVCMYVCMYVYTCYVLTKPPMPIHYVLAAVFASCFYVLIYLLQEYVYTYVCMYIRMYVTIYTPALGEGVHRSITRMVRFITALPALARARGLGR
jgi:hypothetical protein